MYYLYSYHLIINFFYIFYIIYIILSKSYKAIYICFIDDYMSANTPIKDNILIVCNIINVVYHVPQIIRTYNTKSVKDFVPKKLPLEIHTGYRLNNVSFLIRRKSLRR